MPTAYPAYIPVKIYPLRDEAGQVNGYATLDGSGKVPVAQVPDLSATYQPISQKNQPSGYVGLSASSQIVFQADATANLYRSAAGTVKTDGVMDVGNYIVGRQGVYATHPTATNEALGVKVTGDAQDRVMIQANGTVNWGTGAATTDTNLYRAAAAQLKTDGQLRAQQDVVSVGADLWARFGGAAQVKAGDYNGAGVAGLTFGSVADTNLYRSAAGILATNSEIRADSALRAYFTSGGVNQVKIGLTSGLGGIAIGNAGSEDTNLYRLAAATLVTDGQFYVKGQFVVNYGTAAQIQFDPSGLIRWGSPQDTNLYRVAAGILKTDGQFSCAFPALATSKVVDVGAADSGGTGYRMLRVPN